ITDNLNFGNPERPEIMGQIVKAIEGMAEACRALDFPVVSGNVSLYNETDGQAIPPTPVVGAVGLIEDVSKIATLKGAQPGDALILIGETRGHLGASLYAKEILGLEGDALGPPPPVDLEAEKRNADFVRMLIQEGLVNAVHDVSDGGIACAAAEMALRSGVGLSLAYDDSVAMGARHDELLFGEGGARYLVAGAREALVDRLSDRGEWWLIGAISAKQVIGFDWMEFVRTAPVPLARLREAHEGWLPRYMKGIG
ncbi:MAG: AIR synthase-related protein, partial [Pseudomonadota bacterium]